VLKFKDHLTESLASEVKREPKTDAAVQAKKLGLKYMGFGRYSGKDGKVSYIVHNDKLTPFKGADVLQKDFAKAKEEKEKPKPAAAKPKPSKGKPAKKAPPKPDPMKEVEKATAMLQQRQTQDQDLLKKKEQEQEKTHRQLSAYSKTQVFSDEETNAIDQYMLAGAIDVNRYLYKGYDEGTDNQTAEYIQNVITHLDSAMEQSQIPFDYSSYTGLSARYKPEDFKLGETYVFRGYVSTSLSHKTAIEGFAATQPTAKGAKPKKAAAGGGGKVVLQIDHKKGQRGIYVSHDNSVNQGDEKETILPRGTKLKVVSGPHTIDGEVLGGTDSVILFQCKAVDQ
jgi:hypothetical protein